MFDSLRIKEDTFRLFSLEMVGKGQKLFACSLIKDAIVTEVLRCSTIAELASYNSSASNNLPEEEQADQDGAHGM